MDVIMSRYIALFLVAAALGGCCLSPNGCYAPIAATPTAWDGLGSPPTDATEPAVVQAEDRPKKPSSPKKQVVAAPLGESATEPKRKVEGKDVYLQQEAADRAAEERLTRKLMICSNCMPGRTQDDASASR
jgi:hypothetical protein